MLVRLPELTVGGFATGRADGFFTLIELPIREVLLGLMLFVELVDGGFVAVGACTFFTIIGPPIRLLLVMRLLGAVAGGLFGREGAAGGL